MVFLILVKFATNLYIRVKRSITVFLLLFLDNVRWLDSGGEWNTGGGCDLETVPDFGASPMSTEKYTEFKTVVDALSEHRRVQDIELLNVTSMTHQRRDGHSSLYYLGPAVQPSPSQRQDCSHWCLPGVPDSWNELLYAVILKREMSCVHNSTKPTHSPS